MQENDWNIMKIRILLVSLCIEDWILEAKYAVNKVDIPVIG